MKYLQFIQTEYQISFFLEYMAYKDVLKIDTFKLLEIQKRLRLYYD